MKRLALALMVLSWLCCTAAADDSTLAYKLVGYYRMEETWSGAWGDVVDSSGLGCDARPLGSATTTTADKKLGERSGQFSSSTGDKIALHSATYCDFGDDSFSFAMWVKTTQSNYCRFIRKYTATSSYQCSMNAGAVDWAIKGVNGNWVGATTPYGAINDGDWHLLVVTFQNNTSGNDVAQIWIDGVKIDEGTGTIDSVTNVDTLEFPDTQNCLMDEIAIWQRALTPAEIAVLYNGGDGKVIDVGVSLGQDLAGYYRMEETWSGSGSVIDSSGMEQHADAVGAAATTTTDPKLGSRSGEFVSSTSDKISMPGYGDFDFGDKSFSFAMWVKTTQGTYCRFFRKYAAASSYQAVMNAGSVAWDLHGVNGNWVSANTPYNAINDGEWRLLVCTFENNASGDDVAQIWIDGELIDEGTGDIDSISNTAVLGFPYYQNGNLDEVAIWERALRPQEIWSLYSAGRGIVIPTTGTNWYVRPDGGSYGSENGTSYADAWDGLDAVDWNAMATGDNLFICGTHVREVTSNAYIVTQGWLMAQISGTSGDRVEVRGDYPGDPGIVWGAWKDSRPGGMSAGNWQANWDGNTGVYYNETSTYNKAFTSHGLYERINGESYEKYTSLPSVQDVIDSTQDGVYYIEAFGTNQHRVWLRPFHSDFADTLRWSGAAGWRVHLSEDDSFVTYRNLTFFASIIEHENNASTAGPYHDLSFVNCKFFPLYADAWYVPVNAYNITIDNCEIAYTGNGVYVYWNKGDIHHIYVKNSYFHDIGDPWGGSVDGHALGIQNHEHFYFTGNHFERCSSAIDFHVGTANTQRHCYVIGNFIKDMRAGWGNVANGAAILLEGSHDNPIGNTSDYVIANNIIMDCDGSGIATSRKSIVKIYNNTVMDCVNNFRFTGNRLDGASGEMFNNISIAPRSLHVVFNQNAKDITFHFEADNNLYYDAGGGNLFNFAVYGYLYNNVDFAGYVARHNLMVADGVNLSGASMELAALNTNPLLVSSTPSADSDFQLQSSSPAIDAGQDVGLLDDYGGNPRDANPDMGAWED